MKTKFVLLFFKNKITENKLWLFSAFFFIFGLSQISSAYDTPRIYVKDLKTDKDLYQSGETVKGSYTIWNSEEYIMADLFSEISMSIVDNKYVQKMEAMPGKLLGSGSSTKEFSYKLPDNFPKGKYTLKIKIYSGSGLQLGSSSKEISVEGSGRYLNLGKGDVIKEGEKPFDSEIGVAFGPGEAVTIQFHVFNDFFLEGKFKPKFTIYKRQLGASPIKEFFGEDIVLNKENLEKTVQKEMPAQKEPSSYLAQAQIFDENNNPISNIRNFVWIVEGEGAKVLAIKTSDSYWREGEEKEVTVDLIGFSTNGVKPGKLTVNVLNESGKVVASAQQEIELNQNSRSVSVKMVPSQDVNDPKIEAVISKDGKTLDEYAINLNPAAGKETGKKENTLLIFLLAFILLIFIVIFMALLKKKRKLPVSIFFLFFLASLGIFSNAKAEVSITWNSPVKDSVFAEGKPIRFSGDLVTTGYSGKYTSLEVTASVCDFDDIESCVVVGSYASDLAKTFKNPNKSYFDAKNGNIYVADTGNFSIVRTKIDGSNWESFSFGREPIGVAYDGSEYLYILSGDGAAHSDNLMIKTKWNKVGGVTTIPGGVPPLGSWGSFSNLKGDVFYSSSFKLLFAAVPGAPGSSYVGWISLAGGGTPAAFGSSHLNMATGAFYSGGYVYIADTGNDRIIKEFSDESGKTELGGFQSPEDIYYDSTTGFIYVANGGTGQIIKTKIDGTDWTTLDINGGVSSGVDYDPSTGFLYITQRSLSRIVKVRMDGTGFQTLGDGSLYNYVVDGTFPSGSFVKGPNGEVFAKVYIKATRADLVIDETTSYEQIILKDPLEISMTEPIGDTSYSAGDTLNFSGTVTSNLYSTIPPGGYTSLGTNLLPKITDDFGGYAEFSETKAKLSPNGDNTANFSGSFTFPAGFSGQVYFGMTINGTRIVDGKIDTVTVRIPLWANSAPKVTVCNISIEPVCTLGPNPRATFGWTFKDDDTGDTQSAYQMQISDDNFSSIIYDSGKVASSLNFKLTPSGLLEYGKNYYYRVNVWDDKDLKSNPDWDATTCSTNFFAGILHQYPTAKFSYTPDLPATFDEVTFDPATPPDDSQSYGSSSIVSYEWDFENDGTVDSTTTPASPLAKHTFSSSDIYTVNLKVTDSDGYGCWASENLPINTKDLGIEKSIPSWNEIFP